MARRASLDLSGAWRAAPAPVGEPHLGYPEGSADDHVWVSVPVPGHWRATPAFADHDGPLTYRTEFAGSDLRPGVGERSFLVVEGVQAAADVWFDGTYLGDTSGYAIPQWFEVTDLMRGRRDHQLTMEVASEPLGSGENPGGIWRPVRVHTTGPVRVRHCRLRCLQADAEKATLALRVVLDCDEPRTVTLRTWVAPADAGLAPEDGARSADEMPGAVVTMEHEHPLATGENHIEMTVPVPEPDLWWPRALGGQPLYDVGIIVLVDDEPSDGHHWRTGLREVQMDDCVTTVNGERLFLKGVAVGPTQQLLAGANAEVVAGDIILAAGAGLDLVRVHGHLARPELYAEADRAGILLWQDLPLRWAQTRQAREPARQLARSAVDQLAHHPSLLLWCAHHEPRRAEPRRAGASEDDEQRPSRWRRAVVRSLPAWNHTVLDRSVAETLIASDGSRPVLPHRGVWPHGPVLAGSDGDGGVTGRIRGLRRRPRLGGLLAGMGLPAGTPAPGPEGPDGPGQVRRYVRGQRRLKYRPAGGFAAFALPGSTPSWDAFVAACAPVILSPDEMPEIVRVGDRLAVDVHVVSDARQPVGDLRVVATATWEHDTNAIVRAGWAGDVGADAVAHVGTVTFVVPGTAPAPGSRPTLVIDIELRRGDQVLDRTTDHRTVTS